MSPKVYNSRIESIQKYWTNGTFTNKESIERLLSLQDAILKDFQITSAKTRREVYLKASELVLKINERVVLNKRL